MATLLHPCHHHLDVAAVEAALRLSAAHLGGWGEQLAAEHLVDHDGLSIVARNWRCPHRERPGELDLVALDHQRRVVVVVEVKTRRQAARQGGAMAAVPARKHAQLRVLTGAFVAAEDPPYRALRLDLIALDLTRGAPPLGRLTHLRGAL